MKYLFDSDNPITRNLGDLYLDDLIYNGFTTKKLGDCYLWDPYFDDGRKFSDLYLWDEVTTYEYEEDNDIEYHQLDLDPFLTEFIRNEDDFQIFIDLLEIIFSDIRSVGEVFDRLVDVNEAPDIFLPKLASLLYYKYKYEVPTDVNRDIIKRLLWIYEGKGTDEDILQAADFGNDDHWVGRTFFTPGAKVPDRVATIEYPVHQLFTHDVSTHSETDMFQDSERYRDGVIVINLLELTDEVREALRRVIPAGIKIFFNIISDASSDDDGNESVTGRPGILVFGAWFKVFAINYIIDYYMRVNENDNLGSSVFDGDLEYYDHIFSGIQVYFRNFDIDITNVASYIPIYIKEYFGNLYLDFLPLNSTSSYTISKVKAFINRLGLELPESITPSSEGLKSTYNNRLSYNVSPYNDDPGDPVLDTDEVDAAINKAKFELEDVYVYDEDPSTGFPNLRYVTQEVHDALAKAVEEAESALANAKYQYELDPIVDALEKAISEFESQIKEYNPEVKTLGYFKLYELLVASEKVAKNLEDYKLEDYIDYRYPGEVIYSETDIFGKSSRSIHGFIHQLPSIPEFKFSPYTEDPIHDINYKSADAELNTLYDGMPIRSVNAERSGKYRYDGENNTLLQQYPVEDVIPMDDYYPVSAIENLYVNQYDRDSRVAIDYNGVQTSYDWYYLNIDQFKDDDLVDVNGMAVKFSDLTDDQIADIAENGQIKFTHSNDMYLDYTYPMEVITMTTE